jgi:hypothetical protein
MNLMGTNRPQTKNNEFIRLNGCREYGKWNPGIDDEHRQDTKKDTHFHMGTSKTSTGARSSLRKAEPDNSNTTTSR